MPRQISVKDNAMVIVIEEGASGLWYGMTGDQIGPYKGLFIAEKTLDAVIDKIPATIKAMRDAAEAAQLAAIEEVKKLQP
jgi:hypothetical protein